MKKYLMKILILLLLVSFSNNLYSQEANKPKISFSFDDGSISNFPGYSSEHWNRLLLDVLKKHNIKAIFFIKGANLDNNRGKQIILSWNNAGHLIGNHTYNHPCFNSKKVSLDQFKRELIKGDSFVNGYSNFSKLFRFPYLKEGNTIEKRDGFRSFLKKHGYKIGHVTIDASDWYVNRRLIKRLHKRSGADLKEYNKFYIKHIFDRAIFYDSLAFCLTERKINHNLLLHHNLAAALFLDDLIQHFKDKGWEIVDADIAYKDEIYNLEPKNIPAGESLIWALAKETGKYDDILRYPGEDGKYEKDKMDKLGS
jgi:peptidoglycan/xylan/chitin deacetylase (PgdA/CDA1 family)